MNFKEIKLQSAYGRKNLVKEEDIKEVGKYVPEMPNDKDFYQLVDHIVAARKNNRPVIMFMGAHVIKCGLSKFIIELMKKGYVTHIAGNGAFSIHDFELGYLGETSEDVPTAIEDGSFGMWSETCGWMNEAIKIGYKNGWGYGTSIAKYIEQNEDKFPNKKNNVLFNAYLLGIPATIHTSIGTDIIHQHPDADFAAFGATSGNDFHKMCGSVAQLEDGVFLNFGSSVMGPEIFLKALSIARNLGNEVNRLTTANFDLVQLGDYRIKIGYDDPNYYYRPRKNIVNRPTQKDGQGWHFEMNHLVSIPALYYSINEKFVEGTK
jgi:hypothetical protein